MEGMKKMKIKEQDKQEIFIQYMGGLVCSKTYHRKEKGKTERIAEIEMEGQGEGE